MFKVKFYSKVFKSFIFQQSWKVTTLIQLHPALRSWKHLDINYIILETLLIEKDNPKLQAMHQPFHVSEMFQVNFIVV